MLQGRLKLGSRLMDNASHGRFGYVPGRPLFCFRRLTATAFVRLIDRNDRSCRAYIYVVADMLPMTVSTSRLCSVEISIVQTEFGLQIDNGTSRFQAIQCNNNFLRAGKIKEVVPDACRSRLNLKIICEFILVAS